MFGKKKKIKPGAPVVPDTLTYGGMGTIHRTDQLDVETFEGEVIAVWFRCAEVKFEQVEVSAERANQLRGHQGVPIDSIEIVVK